MFKAECCTKYAPSLTPRCDHQVQRLTTLLRGEQRKAKRMCSARRKRADSDPTVPQAAVHVMLCVVHGPQPSQNARDACAMDAHPPASLCSATKNPSGSSVVRSLSAPRVLLLFRTTGTPKTSVNVPCALQPWMGNRAELLWQTP